ncbi:MAG: 3'-5' exonuclease [Deltaproteobacteria bacterium]|jgi:ribonuclease D|nr:3'-5' exonuclease [Deltaproteobacteria bacterium]|tara:strand:- start:944 stop:1600 length:657 start_codon:yes stop_codon:yes gene_type:complete
MTYSITSDIPDNLLELYLSKQEIAIDSEFHGLRLYRDEVCLIQICDDKKNVCLVKPDTNKVPPNLKQLLTDSGVTKIFHFAISDVSFIKTSLDIEVTPFCCTKVMSKLIRTYTQGHGLKDLSLELLGHEINKEQQQTNWSKTNLTQKQLEYAAKDVLDLIQIYKKLSQMMDNRPPLSTGTTIRELNIKAQSMLPGLVELLIHGYGDKDGGWGSSLFSH